MSIAASIALVGALVALWVAAVQRPFAGVPRWRRHRWLGLAALSAGAYMAGDVGLALELPEPIYFLIARLQILAAATNAWCWLRYTDEDLGTLPKPMLRAVPLGLALAVAVNLTPWAFTGRILVFELPWMASQLHNVEPALLGGVGIVLIAAAFPPSLLAYAASARRGNPYAWAHAAAIASILVTGLVDIGTTAGLWQLPFLLDFGLVGEVTAIGVVASRRWAEDARRLDELSERLHGEVEAKARSLQQAETALEQAERLAALGRVAAGVAHEVNNPAAALIGNLQYLLGALALGKPMPADAPDALEDCLHAAQRIGHIARQLLVSSRAARRSGQEGSFEVRSALAAALRTAEDSAKGRARFELHAPAGLHAQGTAHLLEQVIVNLAVNGAQAIPEGRGHGLVRVTAAAEAGRVVIKVDDDGVGMSEQVRARLFEPFFTTKPAGQGTGLGLAVSLGIVRSLGGTLAVESAPGRGTCVTLALPSGVAPEPAAEEPAAPAGPRRTLLLVDDDRSVREAIARSIAPWFEVVPCGSVEEAIGLLPGAELILCDVIMPDGGARALLERLSTAAPALRSRTILFTGGAATPEAHELLQTASQPVLHKPLDVAALREAAERLLAPRTSSSPRLVAIGRQGTA